MSRDRVAIARIVGRRVLIAVWIIDIWLIRLVVVIRRAGKNVESQTVVEMMKPSTFEVMAAKAAASSAAVTLSEVFMASVPRAHVAAVESTLGAAAAASSKSTSSAAAVASRGVCGSHTPYRRNEEQRGEDHDDERSR